MYGLVLQDWVTVSGSTTAMLVQDESDWLDMTPFQDLTAWIQVNEATNAPSLYLETAPSKDDVLFVSMSAGGFPLSTPGVQVGQLQLGLAAVPLAQFLRWRIAPVVSGWDVTFRILLAANAPGMATS